MPPDDDAFLFPHQLQGLRGPLAAWLAAAFQPSALQPNLMPPGISFSGAAGTPPAKPADPRTDVSAVADLVTAKVLAERNLAYPTRAARGPHGRALRLLLWGAALLAAVVQVLVGYASPYLQMLQDHAPPDQTNRSASQKAPYPNNTLRELAQYQAHDNSGEAGKLHSLIARQVADNNAGPCSATGAPAPAAPPDNNGNDLFSARPDTRARAQWRKDYASLADAFNMRLAGRYPFAALAADDLPSPALKQFFDDYGALLAAVRAEGDTHPPGTRGTTCSGLQCDFLRQLDDLRRALAPLLQSGAPLRVAATFNVRPSEASGAEQIVAWTLSSGAATIGPPNRQSGALDWPRGEAISFDLAWGRPFAMAAAGRAPAARPEHHRHVGPVRLQRRMGPAAHDRAPPPAR